MIQGKNIILRTMKESDLDELFNINSDLSERGDFDSFNLSAELKYKEQYKQTGFWEEDSGRLLITDKEGKLIGEVIFFKSMKYCEGYEIGYRVFLKKNRGKGYMTEALKIFSAYMFSIKPISRLQVNMFKGNIGSRKTAEKCGYIYEGTMRKAVFCRGTYYDLELLSLMREECPDLADVLGSL